MQHQGVAKKNVQTTDLSLDRHYDNNGNVTGYDAGETVRAKISPLSHAGRTISSAATSAGNDVAVGQLSFDVANDASLLTEARANAFADAKSRAQQYADLAGRSLGRVQKISETVQSPQPVYFASDAAAAGAPKAASVPIRPGQQTLTIDVTVIWTLG